MDLRFNVAVDRVTDGDTVRVVADVGFKIYSKQIIRLAKINCPETGTPEGAAAKDYTEQWLTTHAKGLLLNCHGQDNYGRWIGTITNAKGVSLNQELMDSGHAKQLK
jgi:micrococcal nuclease